MMPTDVTRWTDARLERELAFARACRDDSHIENLDWLARLEAEAGRRCAANATPSVVEAR